MKAYLRSYRWYWYLRQGMMIIIKLGAFTFAVIKAIIISATSILVIPSAIDSRRQ